MVPCVCTLEAAFWAPRGPPKVVRRALSSNMVLIEPRAVCRPVLFAACRACRRRSKVVGGGVVSFGHARTGSMRRRRTLMSRLGLDIIFHRIRDFARFWCEYLFTARL